MGNGTDEPIFQGRNRDTDAENGLENTGGGEEVERVVLTYTYDHVENRQLVGSRDSTRGSVQCW